MADFQNVAQQFVQYYYQTFDKDRKELAPLYRAESKLTFEGSQDGGVQAIVEKLGGLPFQKVAHQVNTFDAQPGAGGDIVVLVTGALMVDEEQRPMNFVQTFTLKQDGQSYYVFNDVFRLIYG